VGPNKVVRRVWDHSHVLEAKKIQMFLLIGELIAVTCSTVKSTLRIPRHVPYDRPNLPTNSEILPPASSLTIFVNFLHVTKL